MTREDALIVVKIVNCIYNRHRDCEKYESEPEKIKNVIKQYNETVNEILKELN